MNDQAAGTASGVDTDLRPVAQIFRRHLGPPVRHCSLHIRSGRTQRSTRRPAMSLSSGTLNLKFMQRAKARAAVSPSAAPSSTPTPAPPTPSAPTPAQAEAIAAESEKWTLPSRFKPNAEAGPSRPKVTFVGSYLPFVEEAENSGGRRTFGAPIAVTPEVEEDDEVMADAGVHGSLDHEGEEGEDVTEESKVSSNAQKRI